MQQHIYRLAKTGYYEESRLGRFLRAFCIHTKQQLWACAYVHQSRPCKPLNVFWALKCVRIAGLVTKKVHCGWSCCSFAHPVGVGDLLAATRPAEEGSRLCGSFLVLRSSVLLLAIVVVFGVWTSAHTLKTGYGNKNETFTHLRLA